MTLTSGSGSAKERPRERGQHAAGGKHAAGDPRLKAAVMLDLSNNKSMDYLQLLDDLVREYDGGLRRRLDADRELTRLDALIRSTVRMLAPEHQTRGEHVLDHIESRPVGLTTMIRLALSDGDWQTPRQIRDALVQGGWFAAYKSDPLPSIHTTLKRMMPETVESKAGRDGGRLYRLCRGEPLARARAGAERLRAIRAAGHDPDAVANEADVPTAVHRPRGRTPSRKPH